MRIFDAILANQNHVLHQLLPPLSDASQRYILRPRAHNRQLPDRLTFVSLILLILLKCFYGSVLCINILIIFNLQLNCVCSAF